MLVVWCQHHQKVGLMSRCVSEGRVKDFREAEEKRQVDIRIRGFICHGSKDENE